VAKKDDDELNKSILVRRAGILVPLFSVYSKESLGIGDFDDLKLLVDWCCKTGCSILQLLPMNEIGPTFCPYDAVSSFALEPSYISIRSVPGSAERSVQADVQKIRERIPAGKRHVDYDVRKEKLEVLLGIFEKSNSNGAADYKKFIKDNQYWLDDFALYKALKKHHKGSPWYEWEKGYRDRNEKKLDAFRRKHENDLVFEKWVQWIANRQFRVAKEYAASKGVFIKGDLPILVSRDSADVWSNPGYFKLGFSAGAPPDLYCAKGQRWGMPIYDWGRLSEDGYGYIKEKLKYAENFYDMLRVDHVVGLFRIWSIPNDEPMENEGLNGSFDPPDEGVWRDHGRGVLQIMKESTRMLLCAEDLGMIPSSCPETLRELGIPGNDVQRWVKDWAQRHDFLEPGEYRFLSVAMLSTHDTTNWAAWWEDEAGTIDEALFIRKCREKGIDYDSVRERLFDAELSGHGRLRWLDNIDSSDEVAGILGRDRGQIGDIIDMYDNTYDEKVKLWKHLKLKGVAKERCGADVVKAALEITLRSNSVFSIELFMDYLFMANIFKGDPYQYRINRPGTVSPENWSLVMPISLEDMLKHKVCGEIRQMVEDSGRRA